MFTGLVQGKGRLLDRLRGPSGSLMLRVETGSRLRERFTEGSSVAVAGVCLTAVELDATSCGFEVSAETESRTRLGRLAPGDEVNLEPSLRVGDEVGGHWVQGHVDGSVRVAGWKASGEHVEASFDLPSAWRPLVVEKGSIALDGVSLTIAGLGAGPIAGAPSDRGGDQFRVALVPHTLAVTTLGGLRVGDEVHVELDILGKYVARQVDEIIALRLGKGGEV